MEPPKQKKITGFGLFKSVETSVVTPKTIDDIVNHTVGRVLDLIGIDNEVVSRWKGV